MTSDSDASFAPFGGLRSFGAPGLVMRVAAHYALRMMTPAQWKRLALSLPEAEPSSHFDQADFRVRNKIFACLSPDGAVGTLKLTPEIQRSVLSAKPDVFSPGPGVWGRRGWTYVTLARADARAVESLMREAWRLVAPKKLLAAHSGKPTPRKK